MATIHPILLKGGIWIIEGLNLSRIRPGVYGMLYLPLKIAVGPGAPAPVLLKPVGPKHARSEKRRVAI